MVFGLTGVIAGLVVGSFLNVLIWRLNVFGAPKFWEGRSICPGCRHIIGWRDNIPLLSFGLLGGRCRWCRKKISRRYPAVEAVTAVAFGVIGSFWGTGGVWAMGLAAVFIVIFFSDLVYGLIPDEAVAAGIVFCVLGNTGNLGFLRAATATGFVSALIFLAIVLITKFRGMGLGDVKLAFLIGLVLGWPGALAAFWAAFVLGGAAAAVLLVLKRTKLSATIALGPFLVAGVVFSALWSRVFFDFLGVLR